MKSLLKSAVAGAALMAASFAAHAADINIVVVSHGQASDPFWSVVKNGVAEAAKDTGVKVDYRAPETFDMVQMGQLIDAAINQKPQGIVVSIPDADALGPSIQRAVAAGGAVDSPIVERTGKRRDEVDRSIRFALHKTELRRLDDHMRTSATPSGVHVLFGTTITLRRIG